MRLNFEQQKSKSRSVFFLSQSPPTCACLRSVIDLFGKRVCSGHIWENKIFFLTLESLFLENIIWTCLTLKCKEALGNISTNSSTLPEQLCNQSYFSRSLSFCCICSKPPSVFSSCCVICCHIERHDRRPDSADVFVFKGVRPAQP